MDIENCVAIVAGGGSGLGAQTAIMLAAEGAKVAILDLNQQASQALATKIKALSIICDVANADSAESAINQVVQQLGIPRICVNCAGIAPAQRMVGRQGAMALADFKRVIDVNLIGTFNIMRLAAEQMLQANPLPSEERGVIINTASIAAFEGQTGQTAYSASKGGIAAMTLPAARELAQFGVRVMTIAPGLFTTPLMNQLSRQVISNLAANIPFPKRFGEPPEYARLVLHIIQNSYLNAEVIRLDGGLRLPA